MGRAYDCSSRPRWKHTKLVAGRVCVEPPRQLAPLRVELAAAALGDSCRDVVGIISSLKSDVEVQPVLGRPLGGWLRAQLKEGTKQRRVAQGPGRDADRVGPAGQPGPELRIPVRLGRVERERREGSGVGVRRSILHDAAGIALRVGKHHPGHIALTDVEAVSYTHLRAHETDSYLVCRLLLEKKK